MPEISSVAELGLILYFKVRFVQAALALIYQHVYIGDLKGSEYDAFVDFCVVVVDVLVVLGLHLLQERVEESNV